MGGSEKEAHSKRKQLKNELTKLSERLEKLQDMLLDGDITPDQFSNMETRLSDQKFDIQQQLKAEQTTNKKIQQYIESMLKAIPKCIISESQTKFSQVKNE